METERITDTELGGLLAGIAEGYNAPAWYGVNLKTALRGLGYVEASWHPAPEQYSVWELVLHSAYWKFVIWRKLTGEKSVKFPHEGKDWYRRPLPEMTEAQAKRAFKADLALLQEQHRQLMEAVETLTAERRKKENLDFFLRGVAMHDVYHVGQIVLIRAMYRSAQETPKSTIEE